MAYGRITIEKMNGATVCNFRRFGRVMGKNRLNLPAISFTDTSVTKSRMPASVGATQDFNVEFLRFSPLDKRIGNFQGGGRMPASAREQERPTLILRVFRVSRLNEGERGKWNGTEEYIYRLWKAE